MPLQPQICFRLPSHCASVVVVTLQGGMLLSRYPNTGQDQCVAQPSEGSSLQEMANSADLDDLDLSRTSLPTPCVRLLHNHTPAGLTAMQPQSL